MTATQPSAALTTETRAWLPTTDHKRIATLMMAAVLLLFFTFGVFALVMRSQLATLTLRLTLETASCSGHLVAGGFSSVRRWRGGCAAGSSARGGRWMGPLAAVRER